MTEPLNDPCGVNGPVHNAYCDWCGEFKNTACLYKVDEGLLHACPTCILVGMEHVLRKLK